MHAVVDPLRNGKQKHRLGWRLRLRPEAVNSQHRDQTFWYGRPIVATAPRVVSGK
jgi:hypothetical protein